MTYQEFKKKYDGKFVDYDGACGCQCWDLGQAYFVECLGLPPSVLAGCGLVSNMLYPPKRYQLDKYFNEIKITEMEAGDVCIWEYGHIAIFDHWDGKNNWYFSQNPNPCQVIKINAGGLHAFRLKGKEPGYTGIITYQAYAEQWLPEVNKSDNTDNGYAGIYGKSISGFKCKPQYGELIYQAHIKGGDWLETVNSKDYSTGGDNSYAGIYNKPIDCIKIKSTKGHVTYRVHVKGGNWLPWVDSRIETGTESYAGIYGKEIDGIQMY